MTGPSASGQHTSHMLPIRINPRGITLIANSLLWAYQLPTFSHNRAVSLSRARTTHRKRRICGKSFTTSCAPSVSSSCRGSNVQKDSRRNRQKSTHSHCVQSDLMHCHRALSIFLFGFASPPDDSLGDALKSHLHGAYEKLLSSGAQGRCTAQRTAGQSSKHQHP